MNKHRTTEFHQNNSGLVFRWDDHRDPWLAKGGILMAAAMVFILPLAVLRIRVGLPPQDSPGNASVMMLTHGADPMGWTDTARDGGPFPSRFQPSEWPPAIDAQREVFAGLARRTLARHEPSLRNLPDDAPPASPLLFGKGMRQLPAPGPPEIRTVDAATVRLAPVLYPLSGGGGLAATHSPGFPAEPAPELAAQPWRFVLKIAPDGGVSQVVALTGTNVPGRDELVDWLRGHQFLPHDGEAPRWFAVAVTFQNKRIDGTDSP